MEPTKPPIPTPKLPVTVKKEGRRPEAEPDFAEEAAPKSSEFSTAKDAKDITRGEFDRLV
jgi:hypothetical protein